MKFIRTFHPIGQGAFYTEKHLTDDKQEFTVVYDCGTIPFRKKFLHNKITSTLKKNSSIDVLFISHFHTDHINGIEYLKDNYEIKRVVLPLIDDNSKRLFKTLSGSSAVWKLIDNPQSFFKKETKIIQVTTTLDENNDSIESLSNIDSKTINCGVKLTPNQQIDWYYIPYNFEQKERKKELINALKDNGLELTDIDTFEKVIKNKKTIKKAYESINGNLNINSLVLFSGKNKDDYISFMYPQLCADKLHSGCLYTGDVDLPSIKHDIIPKLENHLRYAGTLQIPHHGSVYSFDSSIITESIKCGIISYGKRNTYGHPSLRVIEELIDNSVCVHHITEDPETIVIQLIQSKD